MAKKSDILVARVSAVVKYNGKRVVLHRGKTTAHANHPIVRGHENLFTNLTVDYALDEESETKKRLREEAEKAEAAAAKKAEAEAEDESKVEKEKDEESKPAVKKRAPAKKATTQKEND